MKIKGLGLCGWGCIENSFYNLNDAKKKHRMHTMLFILYMF